MDADTTVLLFFRETLNSKRAFAEAELFNESIVEKKKHIYTTIGSYDNCKSNKLSTNLISGTGKAWAWQRSAKLWPTVRVYENTFESVENVGDLDPTGSVKMYCNAYIAE